MLTHHTPPALETTMATTKKKTTKTTTKKTPAKKTTSKAKVAPKPKVERDGFGSKPTTQSGMINAAMTTKPQTVEAIATKTGLSKSRVRNHMKWLADRDHVTKVEDGYKLTK